MKEEGYSPSKIAALIGSNRNTVQSAIDVIGIKPEVQKSAGRGKKGAPKQVEKVALKGSVEPISVDPTAAV